MKIRFVSMAAFALLVLDSSTGSDAKAFVDSSQGIGPTESSFSQRGLMRTTRIFNFIKNWIIDNKSYEDVTMSTNFINDVGMDSFDFYELSIAVEIEFDVNVAFTMIFNEFLIVEDLVYAIEAAM